MVLVFVYGYHAVLLCPIIAFFLISDSDKKIQNNTGILKKLANIHLENSHFM